MSDKSIEIRVQLITKHFSRKAVINYKSMRNPYNRTDNTSTISEPIVSESGPQLTDYSGTDQRSTNNIIGSASKSCKGSLTETKR